MDETEWLNGTDPGPMLHFVQGKVSERKLRLFAVACCRSVYRFLPEEPPPDLLEVAERAAEGLAEPAEVERAHAAARRLSETASEAFEAWEGGSEEESLFASAIAFSLVGNADAATRAAQHIASLAGMTVDSGPSNETYAAERAAHASLLRDVVGDPFQPVHWLPCWRTSAAVALAEALYEVRELPSGRLNPARLRTLADALEEAGCDDRHVLEHCRGPGPHVRGCFVVDLLTGRG